jgi:KipI family sensor histidine kinase inhibitor
LFDWPGEDDAFSNRKARAVAAHLQERRPPGLIDAVPAARSLLLRFDPHAFDREAVAREASFWETDFAIIGHSRRHEIPVWYGEEAGADLAQLAAERSLSEKDFVRLHCEAIHRVDFLGFAPGFAYLSGLPEILASSRLATPRVRVPAGSVGIAGKYSGIYPAALPGGWRLIGRTPLRIFDPFRSDPAPLAPGDSVKFVPIEGREFRARLEAGLRAS